MSNTWQLQVAKNKFSEVVNRARSEGPQVVTRRGEEVVVIVSVEEWRRHRPRRSFREILMSAPIEGLDLERSPDVDREIDLSDWA